MASIDPYVRHLYPVRVTPLKRVLATPKESGGLPIRRRKFQSRTYLIELRVFHEARADADALEAFVKAREDDGATFTWTNPDDGAVYTCIVDPENPMPRRLESLGYWEFDLVLIGQKP